MTIPEAVYHFRQRGPRRDICPDPIFIDLPSGEKIDIWAEAMVAACLLAGDGWLADCRTDEDLDAAASHAISLYFGEVLTANEWKEETLKVMLAVAQRGLNMAEMLGRSAAMN